MQDNRVGLIAYADRFGLKDGAEYSTISEFQATVEKYFSGKFGHIHLLPTVFRHSGADAGFDCLSHKEINAKLAGFDVVGRVDEEGILDKVRPTDAEKESGWAQLKSISQSSGLMLDEIINHMSSESEWFQDILERGECSMYWDAFLRKDTRFLVPGEKRRKFTEEELDEVMRPRDGRPFTKYPVVDVDPIEFWTTFTEKQIDLNIDSTIVKKYIFDILSQYSKNGVKYIRFDAAGYIGKVPGTDCFLTDKAIDFINLFSRMARRKGITTLVELHNDYRTIYRMAEKLEEGSYVYDFQLPTLMLDAIKNKTADKLKQWLKHNKRPIHTFTVLDTHDGIGMIDGKYLLNKSLSLNFC
ncbi:MAG: hypothetical protein KKF44_10700, partial [Nanoarchaeota archaeon]|nr:hypothetical protein [Nanoarchaeota archaeon]